MWEEMLPSPFAPLLPSDIDYHRWYGVQLLILSQSCCCSRRGWRGGLVWHLRHRPGHMCPLLLCRDHCRLVLSKPPEDLEPYLAEGQFESVGVVMQVAG